MSDKELVRHYEIIEMRMMDIERARETSIEQKQSMYDNRQPNPNYNHLGHLHIGDDWNKLKKEKELIQAEMRKRGISTQ